MMVFVVTCEQGKLVIIKTGWDPEGTRTKVIEKLRKLDQAFIYVPYRNDWHKGIYVSDKLWLKKHAED
jgi:hypothetical protein